MRGKALLYLALIASFAAQGCGSARRSEPVTGPFEVMEEKAGRGRAVFMEHCDQCHPNGEGGLGPALNNKPLPGFLMKFQVRHGIGAMPSFNETHITEGELDDLIAFIKALREHNG